MTSIPVSHIPAARVVRCRLFRGFSVLTFLCVLSGAVLAQTDPNAAGDGSANGNGNGRGRRGQNGAGGNPGGRGNMDPAQFQQQMLDRLREQFGVTDDAEWKVITDRITPVSDLRRANAGGLGLGALRGGQNNPQGGRPGRTASPEQDAFAPGDRG